MHHLHNVTNTVENLMLLRNICKYVRRGIKDVDGNVRESDLRKELIVYTSKFWKELIIL